MRIGILGSGLMGGKLGTLFARAGHDVVFSYARSEQKLKRLARDAKGNARAGTPAEAARAADALLLAVHWLRVDDVLRQAGDLSGKAIVTCSLPMNADDTTAGHPFGRDRPIRRAVGDRLRSDRAHLGASAIAFAEAEAGQRGPRDDPRGPHGADCAPWGGMALAGPQGRSSPDLV